MLQTERPTLVEIRAKWEQRRADASRLHHLVALEAVAADVLDDLAQLDLTNGGELLTLNEGSRESGYSTDHLRHLIADGTLSNAGRKHAPRIRRSDLPRKPAAARDLGVSSQYNADTDALRLIGGAARVERKVTGENR